MDAQTLIAGALVAGCSAWAVWMLLPAGLRARLSARLGLQALPPPGGPPGGCGGCSGCAGSAPAVDGPPVVKIVRRPRA